MSIGPKEGQARETPSPLCRDLVHQTRPVRGPPGCGALGGAGLVGDDSPPLDRAYAQPLGQGRGSLLSMSITSLEILARCYESCPC